jgi:hypothetical protein
MPLRYLIDEHLRGTLSQVLIASPGAKVSRSTSFRWGISRKSRWERPIRT